MSRPTLRPAPVVAGRALVVYVTTVVVGFTALYLLTRSSLLIGDARAFLEIIRRGDPSHLHYGEPGHFLQVPAADLIWRESVRLGLPVSLEQVFVGISLLGTLAAIVFLGLIAAELLGVADAAWIAAILFGSSLNISTQWNGELYGLALGFVCASLFLALRGRPVLAAVLWALSVLSHSEFALAAPAFAGAIWLSPPQAAPRGEKIRRMLTALTLAGLSCAVIMLAGARLIGKWTSGPTLVAWLQRSLAARQSDIFGRPEIGRALKGLFTAYSVAGHYWRDALTGRGHGTPVFVLAAGVGLVVILTTLVWLVASIGQHPLFLLALAWLVPFHVTLNWWFEPTVEKYHAGALPGFVLLVTGGLLFAMSRMRRPARTALCAGYLVLCAGLNVCGALLPMRAFARDTATAERQIRDLAAARGGRATFIACDDPRALVDAGVPFLRIRSVWRGSPDDIRRRLVAWTADRLQEGHEPYLVGRWCHPEEWKTSWSKEPFDLSFLERSFDAAPTGIHAMPISTTIPTDPFSWTRGDIVRLELKRGL